MSRSRNTASRASSRLSTAHLSSRKSPLPFQCTSSCAAPCCRVARRSPLTAFSSSRGGRLCTKTGGPLALNTEAASSARKQGVHRCTRVERPCAARRPDSRHTCVIHDNAKQACIAQARTELSSNPSPMYCRPANATSASAIDACVRRRRDRGPRAPAGRLPPRCPLGGEYQKAGK